MMRDAGAKEVHFRISSPPITHPDYYGIDTPERDKLLAATHDLEGMRKFIGADSLAFLSVEGIYKAMGYEARDPVRPQFTDHCFTGEYPTGLTDQTGQQSAAAAIVAAGGSGLTATPSPSSEARHLACTRLPQPPTARTYSASSSAGCDRQSGQREIAMLLRACRHDLASSRQRKHASAIAQISRSNPRHGRDASTAATTVRARRMPVDSRKAGSAETAPQTQPRRRNAARIVTRAIRHRTMPISLEARAPARRPRRNPDASRATANTTVTTRQHPNWAGRCRPTAAARSALLSTLQPRPARSSTPNAACWDKSRNRSPQVACRHRPIPTSARNK